VGFHLPELTDGASRTWEVTITASDTQNAAEHPAEVTVTVVQELTPATPELDTAPPVRLRLDPAEVRVENRLKVDVDVVVDNGDGKRDRQVSLRGNDPENAVRFGFQRRDVLVPAGQITRVQLSVSADSPPVGQETSRPFSVFAAAGNWEVEATGTLTQASVAAPDNTAQQPMKPLLDRRQWTAVIERGAQAQIEIGVRNTSSIVEEFRVELPQAPSWLAYQQTVAKVMPGESRPITVSFTVKPGVSAPAQTVPLSVQVHSSRDSSLFDTGTVSVTVAGFGPMPSITAHPNVIRVGETVEGRFELRVDNRASNTARNLRVTGSDPDKLVRFRLPPTRLRVAADETADLDVGFRLPELADEANRTWELTISASDAENATERPAEVAVTVIQERARTLPLGLLLDPSLLRVRGRRSGDLEVIIDNREGKRDRRVNLRGDDPENAVRFGFEQPDVAIRAGQAIRIRLSVSADPPPAGQELTRPFSVHAAEGLREVAAEGKFIQATPDSAVKKSRVSLDPQVLKMRGQTTALYRIVIENADGAQSLAVGLTGHDREDVVRFAFSPDRFDVPPGGRAWGWVRVWVPRPGRGRRVTREISVVASDGTDSTSATGTIVQTGWVRRSLDFLGGASKS
jgi:hypothetical protein